MLTDKQLQNFQRHFMPPSSGSRSPRTLVGFLKPFFEMSVNIYNLVWHTIPQGVNLDISFVWICCGWWSLKEGALSGELTLEEAMDYATNECM
jgi:hypothetical protein